jgi:hypothetical protein
LVFLALEGFFSPACSPEAAGFFSSAFFSGAAFFS